MQSESDWSDLGGEVAIMILPAIFLFSFYLQTICKMKLVKTEEYSVQRFWIQFRIGVLDRWINPSRIKESNGSVQFAKAN